jgi:oligoribonuclease NrnB/cAMP/cGMP phosphodiesterase (DHH superfamily)
MLKYYVPELNLRDIRNKGNIIEKFTNKFNKEVVEENIIISNDGFYKQDTKDLIKYKLVEKDSNCISNFFKNYTLIGIDSYEKKIGIEYSLPSESTNINIKKIKFNIGKSENFIVFEEKNNKIIDVYFLSKKKLYEKNIFFLNDVSLFIEMLM